MGESEWPKPPIKFEDLPLLIELCGGWLGAKRELAGWVLVPPSLTLHPQGSRQRQQVTYSRHKTR